jgi:hypothetical protein
MAFLLAVLTVSALAMSAVLAQQPMRVKTFPFINAIPNPVGVGQEVLFHTGILLEHLHGYGWNVEVIITMPNETIKKIPAVTDSTGGTGVTFVPDKPGTYKVQTHFPEQAITVDLFVWEGLKFFPKGTIFEESYSDVLDLIVQEEPVPVYPGHPLPSEYWVRPIDSQLREWNVIGGNWLYGTGPYRNVFAPNNEYAPETPHILWAKTLRGDIGALVGGGGGVGGGEYDAHGYKTGDAYEGEWLNPIIISGVLYYNKYWSALTYDTEIYPGAYSTPPGVVAIDLHTGEVLWERDDIRVSFGQIYEYDSPNQHGAIAYLIEDTAWARGSFTEPPLGDGSLPSKMCLQAATCISDPTGK